jgi:hypothetical protein
VEQLARLGVPRGRKSSNHAVDEGLRFVGKHHLSLFQARAPDCHGVQDAHLRIAATHARQPTGFALAALDCMTHIARDRSQARRFSGMSDASAQLRRGNALVRGIALR